MEELPHFFEICPIFPLPFVFYPWKSDSILHSRKLPPSKILSPKNWTMAFRNGETRTDVRRQRKRKRKKEKRGKNKEELSRSGAWALAFRHWPGWTTRLNNRRYVTGVYAFTDEEAGKEEREATVPTGRERGGGRGRRRARKGAARFSAERARWGPWRSITYVRESVTPWGEDALFFLPSLPCLPATSLFTSYLCSLLFIPRPSPASLAPAWMNPRGSRNRISGVEGPGSSFLEGVAGRKIVLIRGWGMDFNKIGGVRIVNGWLAMIHELCSLFGEGKGGGREKLQALIFRWDVSSVPEWSNLSIPRIERVVDHFDNASRLVKSKW